MHIYSGNINPEDILSEPEVNKRKKERERERESSSGIVRERLQRSDWSSTEKASSSFLSFSVWLRTMKSEWERPAPTLIV